MNRKEAIQHINRYIEEIQKLEGEQDLEQARHDVLRVSQFYTGQIMAVINPMTDIEIPFIRAALLLAAEKILCVKESARIPADVLYQILVQETSTLTVPVKKKQ